MEILGFDFVYLIGLGLIVGAGIISVLLVVGLITIVLFWKTRKVVIPSITLFTLDFLGVPMRYLLWIFRIDDSIIESMIVDIRNKLYKNSFSKIPYHKRALFLPQCLRNPICQAPLTPEGIKCMDCGRCGIFKIKDFAESLGYKVFIAPGSTIVKRMVSKYKPQGILGVGCSMEVREGTAKMATYGLPVQGIVLLRDGCMDTRADVLSLIERIKANSKNYSIRDDPGTLEIANKISALWEETIPTDIKIKDAKPKSLD